MGVEKLSRALMKGYEGKGIADICTNGMTGDSDNHCAHFVNHVLSQTYGYTCGKATGKDGASSNVRVHETFKRCVKVGKWSDLGSITKAYVFITYKNSVNVKKKTMTNRPNKHMGIYCDGTIWHYSNTKDKVVTQTPKEFAKHYSGSAYSLFYGTFPTDIAPVEAS